MLNKFTNEMVKIEKKHQKECELLLEEVIATGRALALEYQRTKSDKIAKQLDDLLYVSSLIGEKYKSMTYGSRKFTEMLDEVKEMI